jgi:hypothetical protein
MSPTELVRLFRNTCGSALTAMAIFTAAANAQGLHDFGGTWVVIESRPRALARGETRIVTVAAGNPPTQISIERHLDGATAIDRYWLSVIAGVDGRETAVTTSARWVQDTLVMTKETYFSAIDAKPFLSRHEEWWSIGDQGRLRIRVVDQDDNLERRVSELVCEKQR